MPSHTIIFRADASPSIGMGHFTRTLALAEMLHDYFHCIFATRKATEYQISEIEKICHARIDLPEDDTHFKIFLTHLKGDEIVVLDNYYFTTEYQSAIKAKGCKLVCIDDLHDQHFVADVIINHAEGVDSSVYSVEPYTKLLLGFKYALLRKEFRVKTQLIKDKKYSCLIMIGGTDPFGITNNILEQLSSTEMQKPIAVIANSKSCYNNVEWVQNQTASEVAKLMENAEFGIFSASSVAIEACAKRLPFICGYFVKNQMDIYHGIKNNKIALCIGDFNELSECKLLISLRQIMTKKDKILMQVNQRNLLDNNSHTRFIKLFREL